MVTERLYQTYYFFIFNDWVSNYGRESLDRHVQQADRQLLLVSAVLIAIHHIAHDVQTTALGHIVPHSGAEMERAAGCECYGSARRPKILSALPTPGYNTRGGPVRMTPFRRIHVSQDSRFRVR